MLYMHQNVSPPLFHHTTTTMTHLPPSRRPFEWRRRRRPLTTAAKTAGLWDTYVHFSVLSSPVHLGPLVCLFLFFYILYYHFGLHYNHYYFKKAYEKNIYFLCTWWMLSMLNWPNLNWILCLSTGLKDCLQLCLVAQAWNKRRNKHRSSQIHGRT